MNRKAFGASFLYWVYFTSLKKKSLKYCNIFKFYFSNLPESRAAAAGGGGLSWIGGGLSYLGGGLSYTAGFSRITGGGLSRITGGAGVCACLDLTLDGADDGFLKKKTDFSQHWFYSIKLPKRQK